MQHVEAAHPLHARDDVADQVVADVADVRVPRGVREHLEAVELGLRGIFSDLERPRAAPAVLPLLLYGLGLVLRHDPSIISCRPRGPGSTPRCTRRARRGRSRLR
jgi:hypothetical protein